MECFHIKRLSLAIQLHSSPLINAHAIFMWYQSSTPKHQESHNSELGSQMTHPNALIQQGGASSDHHLASKPHFLKISHLDVCMPPKSQFPCTGQQRQSKKSESLKNYTQFSRCLSTLPMVNKYYFHPKKKTYYSFWPPPCYYKCLRNQITIRSHQTISI